MEPTRTDRYDIGPAFHIATAARVLLIRVVVSNSDDGTVGPETDSMGASCADCDYIRPAGHVAPAEVSISLGNNGAVGLQAHSVIAPRSDGIPKRDPVPDLKAPRSCVRIGCQLAEGDGGFAQLTLRQQLLSLKVAQLFFAERLGGGHSLRKGGDSLRGIGLGMLGSFCHGWVMSLLKLRIALLLLSGQEEGGGDQDQQGHSRGEPNEGLLFVFGRILFHLHGSRVPDCGWHRLRRNSHFLFAGEQSLQ